MTSLNKKELERLVVGPRKELETWIDELIAEAIVLAAAEEREACAAICDDNTAPNSASQIRSRGKP